MSFRMIRVFFRRKPVELSALLVARTRFYCDKKLKTNEHLILSSNVTPSIPPIAKIKKAIRTSGKFDLQDLSTCLKTQCPVCLPIKTKTTKIEPSAKYIDRNNIFVNKTTGWLFRNHILLFCIFHLNN